MLLSDDAGGMVTATVSTIDFVTLRYVTFVDEENIVLLVLVCVRACACVYTFVQLLYNIPFVKTH